MFETAIVSFATFFATIGPLDLAAVFAVLTAKDSKAYRKTIAIRGTAIAAMILLPFALFGEIILSSMGISLAALSTAGGILLLLMGIEMVFARETSGTPHTDVEEKEANEKHDISVFPLATPLIAGPGSMGAAILLMANAEGDYITQAIVLAALLAILLVTLIALLLAGKINDLLGLTGMRVISRVMGVLLCALAVQFIFNGLSRSGLF